MSPALARPRPSRGRDLGLTLLALGAMALGWGSWFPAIVTVGLVVLWWGRPIGVAALLAAAVTLAAWASGGHAPRARAMPAQRAAATATTAERLE